ncbi:MAG: hypothetical protein ACRDP1_01040 [Nocardioidaceae bacterium]
MSLQNARAVADAVLYEGYLLYPYRATSQKNQTRWQFGVVGPPGAAEAGVGEEAGMSIECVLQPGPAPELTVHLRFLHLQQRSTERAVAGGFTPVPQLSIGTESWISWDEAVECELTFGPIALAHDSATQAYAVAVPGATETENLRDSRGQVAGRLVRRRWPLSGTVRLHAEPCDGFLRLRVDVENTTAIAAVTPQEAVRGSFLGAHLLLVTEGAEFVSLLDPPPQAQEVVDSCRQHRCWPVLAGPPGDTSVLLGSPIIVYDHPEIAEQSAGNLFDATEIDEILTLRVMTMTEAEKAEARATDPRAAEIIDRCDGLTPEQLQQMHGVLRAGHTDTSTDASIDTDTDTATGVPWWDPESDASVHPESDTVLVNGVAVAKGSMVRLHPGRRADAQDLFFADQVARVTSVHSDVDGNTHVAVVLVDDPAAELHDWYGRYLYFAPDEVEPLVGVATQPTGEERTS